MRIRGEEWERAHSIFVSKAAPTMILSGSNQHVITFAKKLRKREDMIRDWENNGGVYLDYCVIVNKHKLFQEDNLEENAYSLYNQASALVKRLSGLIQRRKFAFKSRLVSEKRFLFNEKVCLSEMSTKLGECLVSFHRHSSQRIEATFEVSRDLTKLLIPDDHRIRLMEHLSSQFVLTSA